MERVGESRVKGFNRRERRKAFNRKVREEKLSPQRHRGTEKIGDCRSVENAFQCRWLDGETRGPSTVLGCRLAPLRMTGLKEAERESTAAKEAKTVHPEAQRHRGTEKIGDCRSVENAFQCRWWMEK
jgi:hypothetical protein